MRCALSGEMPNVIKRMRSLIICWCRGFFARQFWYHLRRQVGDIFFLEKQSPWLVFCTAIFYRHFSRRLLCNLLEYVVVIIFPGPTQWRHFMRTPKLGLPFDISSEPVSTESSELSKTPTDLSNIIQPTVTQITEELMGQTIVVIPSSMKKAEFHAIIFLKLIPADFFPFAAKVTSFWKSRAV
jgi:hypothetical protein